MKYENGLTPKQIQETNRQKILKAFEKPENQTKELTFAELLDLRLVSRGSLNTHLKALIRSNDIEKCYSKTKDRIAYRLTEKGIIPLTIKSMIQHLGILATYKVWIEKSGMKITLPETLEEAIESYVKADSKISSKIFMEHLKENYFLQI